MYHDISIRWTYLSSCQEHAAKIDLLLTTYKKFKLRLLKCKKNYVDKQISFKNTDSFKKYLFEKDQYFISLFFNSLKSIFVLVNWQSYFKKYFFF